MTRTVGAASGRPFDSLHPLHGNSPEQSGCMGFTGGAAGDSTRCARALSSRCRRWRDPEPELSLEAAAIAQMADRRPRYRRGRRLRIAVCSDLGDPRAIAESDGRTTARPAKRHCFNRSTSVACNFAAHLSQEAPVVAHGVGNPRKWRARSMRLIICAAPSSVRGWGVKPGLGEM